ncbi:hypothetical protein L209DRAFT_70266 [Thermothelomyces heterothallicus CBS 203.75]
MRAQERRPALHLTASVGVFCQPSSPVWLPNVKPLHRTLPLHSGILPKAPPPSGSVLHSLNLVLPTTCASSCCCRPPSL